MLLQLFLFVSTFFNTSIHSFSPIVPTTTVPAVPAVLLSPSRRRTTTTTTLVSVTSTKVTGYYSRNYFHHHHLFSTNNDDDDEEEGASLAADFFKTIQSRNIQLDEYDFLDDDDEDDDDENENDSTTSTTTYTGKDNTNNNDEEESTKTSLSDNQLNNELNERVLETAGGFVDLVRSAKDNDNDDDDDDDDDDDELLLQSSTPKVYEPPKTIPDPALTAGEVVMTVLEALNNNDNPTPDYGIQVLFGYSSAGSAISQAIQVEGMTPAEYATFLKEEYEYKILFHHDSNVMIEKGDYSFDRKKAFFTARLSAFGDGETEGGDDFTNVNFILSTDGQDDDDCWLIDSLLIRPPDMRRRRRR